MVRYFYAWTPLVIVVGTVVVLTNAYLALVALMIASLVGVAALKRAIVSTPYMRRRAISRRRRGRTGGSPRTTAALSPARRQAA